MEFLKSQQVKSGVMLIELNRPEKRNALNNATLQELVTLLKSVDADSNIKTVVISGMKAVSLRVQI